MRGHGMTHGLTHGTQSGHKWQKWQISIFFIKKSGNGKGNDKAFGRVMKIYAEIYNKGSHHNERGHGVTQGVHLWGSIWV